MKKIIGVLGTVTFILIIFGLVKRNNTNIIFPNRSHEQITSPESINPMLHTDGMNIVDGEGNLVVFRGVNVEGWLQWQGLIFGAEFKSETEIMNSLTELAGTSEAIRFQQGIYHNFLTEKDFERMKLEGFNAVRIPINHKALEEDIGWNLLDQAISWGEQYNIYILLDLHAVPGGQSRLFVADPDKILVWEDELLQNQTVSLWREIANRYKDKTIVAGYDLLNEPDPPSNTELLNLYAQITDAIRSVDPYHLIIYEGTAFSTDFSLFEKPLDYNQAYSFHTYSLLGPDKKEEIFQTISNLARQQNIPFFNGEFGANTYDWTGQTVELFNHTTNNMSGWYYWNWKNTPNKNSEKYTNLWEIHAGDNWQKVATWLSWPYFPVKKPTLEETRSGIDEIISAIQLNQTSVDRHTLQILQK